MYNYSQDYFSKKSLTGCAAQLSFFPCFSPPTFAGMEKNLKAMKAGLAAHGVFYTDEKLAGMLASFMPPGITEVYDPTCGDGALLRVFPDSVAKYGQELDPAEAAKAARLPNAHIAEGDTLQTPAFMNKRFQGIVANPPFSIKWEQRPDDPRFTIAPAIAPRSRADYAFILHCLSLLADDGVLAVLEFPGVLYRGQKEGIIRRWLVESGYIHQVVAIEGGHFVDTKTSTCILVIKKTPARSIVFTDNLSGKTREVSLVEIAQNDYNLSVNNYIQEDIPDKFSNFDPVAVEMSARDAALKRIKAEIEFSRMVAEFEGFDVEEFLDGIIRMVSSYKKQPSSLL